jgi:hypothetical protein
MTQEEIDRCMFWAKSFEDEAAALEKGPNEPAGIPLSPILIKARIDAARGMAADLRKQIIDGCLNDKEKENNN